MKFYHQNKKKHIDIDDKLDNKIRDYAAANNLRYYEAYDQLQKDKLTSWSK